MSGHPFCRRHSSHFCPCLMPWLYTATERAAYESRRWPAVATVVAKHGDLQEESVRATPRRPRAHGWSDEAEHLELFSRDEEILP
jgi:hypothetical protein